MFIYAIIYLHFSINLDNIKVKNEIHLNQMDKIILSNHSIEKIKILNIQGFQINKKAVVNIMKNPDKIISGYKDR